MKQRNKPHMLEVLRQSHRSGTLIKKLGWPVTDLTNIEQRVTMKLVSTTKRKQRSVSKTQTKGQKNDDKK